MTHNAQREYECEVCGSPNHFMDRNQWGKKRMKIRGKMIHILLLIILSGVLAFLSHPEAAIIQGLPLYYLAVALLLGGTVAFLIGYFIEFNRHTKARC